MGLPSISSAKLTLSYPVYAADFDPNNSGFLVVGGGGGEGRSGVGNKITLIDASKKEEITEVVEIDLSPKEDSVTSLAVAQSSESSVTVYAGINSSTADQQAGKNEHLRAFRLGYPLKRKREQDEQKGGAGTTKTALETTALGKASLFTPLEDRKKETYQRIIRLSPLNNENNSRRLGAITTGLGSRGEVVIFNAAKVSPTSLDIRRKITPAKGKEAADVDIIERKDGDYLVAYCTEYEVYCCVIPANAKALNRDEPQLLHGTPHADVLTPGKKLPTFRSLRFLAENLILLLQNLPNRKGAEILLLDVPTPSSRGRITLRKQLDKAIKAATSLSVALLPPLEPTQNMQHVIAVGAQDISLLSLDHSPTRSGSYRLEFRTHSLLRNLHPNQITTLAFSSFTPPATAPTATSPQYLKLASTSMACTVIVHTIPLVPYTFNVGAKKKSTRYTLRPPGSTEGTEIGFSAVIAIMIVAFGAFFLQAWTEIRGGTPEFLGAKGWLSPKMHDYLARPYMFEDAIVLPTSIPTVESVRNRVVEEFDHAGNKLHEGAENLQGTRKRMPLREILRQHRPVAGDVAADPVIEDAELEFAAGTRRAVVVVRDHGEHLGAELHEDEEVAEEQGTRWEKLSRAERDKWKKRLVQAGEWAFEEGEAVLKGVFFGELAAVVAGAVG